MAALATPHWEATLPGTRSLLLTLGKLPSTQLFYLAGGTALALRLGHRLSVDLDLFANIDELTEELRRRIITELQTRHPLELVQDSPLGLYLKANNQAVSFFTYGYSLLEPADPVEGLPVAGLLDIGLMKLDAIAGRGERKDFYDVYGIARYVSLDQLFDQSQVKYPHSHGFQTRVLSALVDFDKADRQSDPTLLASVDWQTVKAFFQAETARLGKQWFELLE